MKRLVFAVTLLGLLMMPLIANLAGWNLYLITRIGAHKLHLGAADGLSHNAWEEEKWHGGPIGWADLVDSVQVREVTVGRFCLLSEHTGGGLKLLRFGAALDPDYRYVEFPWWMLFPIPFLVFAISLKKRNESE